MVIHDPQQQQQWAQAQQTRSRAKTPSKSKQPRRLSLVAVQCLACGVILVVALLFRVAGGSAYIQLQQRFEEALAGNELMTVLMQWWDGDPTESASLWEEEGVKEQSFTPSSGCNGQGVLYADVSVMRRALPHQLIVSCVVDWAVILSA